MSQVTGAPARIDALKPGTIVTLAFHKLASTTMERGGRVDHEDAVFLGVEGTGEERTASFVQYDASNGLYKWQAYRYNGRWAFGSSAERLSVVAQKFEV